MRLMRHTWIVPVVCLLGAAAITPCARAADWLPVPPDELSMTSEPQAPGAAAVILYRQVDRDDSAGGESQYIRIKILTAEGRKYADVEIAFEKNSESIRGIEARTIHPDGSIIEFDGTVYEKTIVKAKGVKYLAKTFSLPDVQVGSIIEYRYRRSLQYGFVFDSHWILSQDLYTRHAKFTLDPYGEFTLRYSWPVGLPPGTDDPRKERGKLRLETRDVPAFVTEEYMPPENELKYRVDFIYDTDSVVEKDQDKYWKRVGKKWFGDLNRVINRRRAMERAVAQIVQPGDAPEAKLRRIYARVQQIRNVSFEPEKAAEEIKREKLESIDDVEDVWNRGYGGGMQITWLFLALARAAGFQADPVLVSSRDSYFFNPRVMNSRQLDTNVVLVKLDGRDFFLDPGMPFTPFGMLPWNETAVKGLLLDKDGGSWVSTPLPPATDSGTERVAVLRLTDTGSLEGKVTVTYTGLEASWRRLEERNEDETERKRFLEGEIDAAVPAGIDVVLTNRPDWGSSDAALVAEFDLKVPGWAVPAGRRALLAVGLFGGAEKHQFEHSPRTHGVYFNFPARRVDDLRIALPPGWQPTSVPQARSSDLKSLGYSSVAEASKDTLHVRRELSLRTLYLDTKYYGWLQGFYQFVRSSDEEQFVLAVGAAPKRQ